MFSVTILGNNSAVPAYERLPTSQLVTMDGQKFLVDCGEGTQLQLMRYKIKYSRISHIFISHLHGDHYFGLIGLINSFGLLNRQQDLIVFGPPPLKKIIELQLQVASTRLPFSLQIKEIAGPGLLYETEEIEVSCFTTDHRITCYGFSFCEKTITRKRLAQQGQPRRYAYCADTRYNESLLEHIDRFDLLYHESTYLDDQREKAELRFHSTARQAALLAQKAQVKRLLLGHFSSQHEQLDQFETEAREIFPATELAEQGVTYLL
ncbi:MAG: MBL fold metallo-hydrolase [Sphingomonadales bacterium]|nr:MBL fold metallo-hydrolase [Sphingomonadales bacterium]